MSIPDQQSIVLEFSFVGMKTKTVTYTGQKEINVVLEEDVSEMEEVVVTGYQKIERRKLTSSITTVDMDRLRMVNQPSIDKLLQGQVPGMTIVSTSGAPGAVPQIRIREHPRLVVTFNRYGWLMELFLKIRWMLMSMIF